MGDSETMVAEASAAETYPSDGYNNTSSNPVPEAGANVPAPAEIAGEAAAAQPNSGYAFAYSGDGNAYTAGDPNSVLQAQFSATNESKQAAEVPNEDSSLVGKEAMDSAMVSADHSSVNGSVDTVGLENGNASENVDESADEKQLTDAYGMDMPFLAVMLAYSLGKVKLFRFYYYWSFVNKKIKSSMSRLCTELVSNMIN